MSQPKVAYQRKSAQQRQQELIEAGIACLGHGGMSAFTIDNICKRAGVSRGLINHHFKTKEDLLIRIYADMTAHLIEDHCGDTPQQRLAAIINTSFDEDNFNKSNLRAWLSLWGQVPTHKKLGKIHRERYQIYKHRIETALFGLLDVSESNLDSDSVARQLIALIDGLWLEYCLNSEGFSLACAKNDCHQFLQGYGITV